MKKWIHPVTGEIRVYINEWTFAQVSPDAKVWIVADDSILTDGYRVCVKGDPIARRRDIEGDVDLAVERLLGHYGGWSEIVAAL
ncbi:MAG: hypothetical protein HUU17_12940 [Chthonomonadales bacterium]|nr:hypothetical protein [Chthonomonadales bacterium]